ncbi:MAG: translation elongation factor Ts [Treponemataceae bacterium]
MEIKAADIKALREKTGAGMMECKKALDECAGDAEKAAKLLKEKGLAAVEKRSERATKEGSIFIKTVGAKTIVAELTCETDFVAKNPDFVKCGEAIIETAFAKNYSEVNEELSNVLLDFATKTRENMSLRRLQAIETPSDCVLASYIHSDKKTGVVVQVKVDPASAKDKAEIKQFAYDCCLHIAAFSPAFIKREDVDPNYIAEQTEIFKKQTDEKEASKPENVRENITKGKINKHLAEICFMDQAFVKDDKMTVAKKMEEVGKQAGAKLSIAGTVNFILN